MNDPLFICSRPWSNRGTFYVSDVKPGLIKVGARGDWGYTTDYRKAIPLTRYQMTRFASDVRACGAAATTLPIPEYRVTAKH